MTTTTAKHTPGPWTVSGLPEIYGHDCINANGPEPVATILRRFVRAENEANAHLIAAAPDLLAACKVALEERSLREELSAIGSRSRERHHTVEAMRIDENRKREILAKINENGRTLRAAIAKAEQSS